MMRLMLDIVLEYLENKENDRFIGNERLAELEYAFNEILNAIIDNRIKSANEQRYNTARDK